jgi:hypothetical protein
VARPHVTNYVRNCERSRFFSICTTFTN